MCGVPHHMVAVADPGEQWSVARYSEAATACVDDILSRGKLPIVAGGTGLYVSSLAELDILISPQIPVRYFAQLRLRQMLCFWQKQLTESMTAIQS